MLRMILGMFVLLIAVPSFAQDSVVLPCKNGERCVLEQFVCPAADILLKAQDSCMSGLDSFVASLPGQKSSDRSYCVDSIRKQLCAKRFIIITPSGALRIVEPDGTIR